MGRNRLYRIFTPTAIFIRHIYTDQEYSTPGVRDQPREESMDLVFLGLTVVFFALTWGLIEYSDRLMGGK